MEELYSKLEEFDNWLYDKQSSCRTKDYRVAIDDIIRKWEELELNKLI